MSGKSAIAVSQHESIECPLCCGVGKLSRAEILDRLGVKDFARVAQLSAEEAFRLLQNRHDRGHQNAWSRSETELAKRVAEIREQHKDAVRSAQSDKDDLTRRVEACLREVAELRERNQALESELSKVAHVGKREEMEFAEEARSWAGVASGTFTSSIVWFAGPPPGKRDAARSGPRYPPPPVLFGTSLYDLKQPDMREPPTLTRSVKLQYNNRSLGGRSSSHRQRKHHGIDPRIVLSAGHVGKQPPVLHMLHYFSRPQFDHRPKRLQLDEVTVSEYLKIAAEIGIPSAADDRRSFDEEITLPEISPQPAEL